MFYNVETLDPEDPSDTGRAKKLADYIVAGQKTKDAFLPTSIFLATHKSIPFNEQSNTIEIDIVEIGPFSVVDGQHRVRERAVEIGLETPTKYQVLSGLEDGELVVIGNLAQLRPNQQVEARLTASLARE